MANDAIAPRVQELLTRQGGVVSLSQLSPTYIATRRAWLRRALLLPLHRGTYVDAAVWEEATAEQRVVLKVRALQLAVQDVVAYARTAALVNQLPVAVTPREPEVARATGASRLSNFVVHRTVLLPGDVVNRRGVFTTSLVRTAVDVATGQTLPDSLVTMDAVLRRGCGKRALREHLVARGAIPGRLAAATAIDVSDKTSESPLESMSRGYMHQLGMRDRRAMLRYAVETAAHAPTSCGETWA